MNPLVHLLNCSHASEEENHTRNHSKNCKCKCQTVKYYFCVGNFSVINGSCAKMKAERLRMVA
jgi:hypothetical protein